MTGRNSSSETVQRRLSDDEVDLLIKARELMATCTSPSEFICWNLLFAATGCVDFKQVQIILEANYGLEKVDLYSAVSRVGGAVLSLYDSIDVALEGEGCLDNYLSEQIARAQWCTGTFIGVDARAVADQHIEAARMCWMDRMIETRSI